MATVQGQYSFYALRFLLGATEAGAVPIMLYYASCWTPQRDQGALFKISTLSWPLAVVIGAPLASLLMNHLHQVGGKIGRASGRKECVSPCRTRWSPYHYTKKISQE